MSEFPQADELVTVRQAYVAAFVFIEAFWERGLREGEELRNLLSWMDPGPSPLQPASTLANFTSSPDPAQLADFIAAIEKARALCPVKLDA